MARIHVQSESVYLEARRKFRSFCQVFFPIFIAPSQVYEAIASAGDGKDEDRSYVILGQ